MTNRDQQFQGVEKELAALTRSINKGNGGEPIEPHFADEPSTPAHPALIACQKAADMVRGIHERHVAEGETLARHIEQIGENIHQMCKETAQQIREQRILPKEMSDQMADELVNLGREESQRQTEVAQGLRIARDALLGIDQRKEPRREQKPA